MSDTPRTDFQKALVACVEYRAMVDKLERENADLQMSLRNWIDKCAAQAIRLGDLERENAALREALDTLTHVIGLTPIAGNKAALQEAFDMARAALRKEAQP